MGRLVPSARLRPRRWRTASPSSLFRLASLPNQTFEGYDQNLRLGVKAQGSMAKLIDSLQKLRGETGKQTVHVHHHNQRTDARTQVAATFNLSALGEGQTENGRQPHEPDALAYEPGLSLEPDAAMRREEQAGQAVPSPGDAQAEEVPTARRQADGSAEG